MAKKKDKFLLVSLEESKTKKLAQVIGSDTCRKILDFLADKEASESDISKQLSLPISTVHYNIQQLMDAGMIEVEEFHYSAKGREVNHYKLANKFIIIAPKQATLGDTLKKFLPVAIIGVGAALGYSIYRFYRFFGAAGATYGAADTSLLSVGAPSVAEATGVAKEAAVASVQSCPVQPFPWAWVVGAFVVGLIVAFVTMLIAKKLRK